MFEVFRAYVLRQVTISETDFALIESFAHAKKLRKRQYLLQEGDICRNNYFITKGLLRSYSVDNNGDEHIIRFAMENWWISDRESMLTQQPSRFNIDAIEDSEVLLFDNGSTEMLMEKVPAFGKMIRDMLNKSLIASHNRILETISTTAEEKYANFMQRYPEFALRVPQAMIASYLGITPETLSRLRKRR